MKELSLFERIITEAPEDEVVPDAPPDIPPDMPEVQPPDDNLDIGAGTADAPPDAGMTEEDTGGDMGGGMDFSGEEETPSEELELDEKISSILNMNLYQRFLSLLNNIGNQLSLIKSNSDVIRTIHDDSLELIGSLKKLDENIRLYLNNYFMNENYSKNLLFFNKCINLMHQLNNNFSKEIDKGIRSLEVNN